jgi:hypothetical protein
MWEADENPGFETTERSSREAMREGLCVRVIPPLLYKQCFPFQVTLFDFNVGGG